MDKVSDHLPEFAARGKADITLEQVMTHQGGFPNNNVTKATWTDHARMRAEVCDFSLDWTPGSKLQYHGQAAHLVQAMVIEAVTGQDYRDVIRTRVIEPLGLGNDIFVGVPTQQQNRCADTYAPEPRDNSAEFRAAGLPQRRRLRDGARHGGVLSDAGAGGRLGNVRLFSPRLIAYVSRNHTGETRRRADEWHSDASRAGAACARRERPHPRAGHDRRAGRRSVMAASGRRIPGPIRAAACRSPI